MSEDTTDKLNPTPNQAREFTLDPDGQIRAIQKGRVTRLTHPTFGTTYLIDVTEREDPTMYEEDDKTTPRETLDQVFADRAENPREKDHYAYNNGVVVLVTARLDPENRSRIYSGVAISDLADEKRKEISIRSPGKTRALQLQISLKPNPWYVHLTHTGHGYPNKPQLFH